MELQHGTSRFLLSPSRTLVHPTTYFYRSATFSSLRGKAFVDALASLGDNLGDGPSWANLEPTRANMGQLGAILGQLGINLDHLGPT